MKLGSQQVSLLLSCSSAALFSSVNASHQEFGLQRLHRRRSLTSSKQVDFVNQCSSGLLSDEVLSDKIITQKEFTETYLHLCSDFGVEDCEGESFEALDEDIQFAFASSMCHTGSSNCLQSLITIGNVMKEVGYIVSSDRLVVENLVNNICYELEYAVFGVLSDGVELVDVDESYNDTLAATGATATGTNTTNIVGAATAGSACLLLLFLVSGERRNQRQRLKSTKDSESGNSYTTESSREVDSVSDGSNKGALKTMQKHPAQQKFNPSISSEADEVFRAIGRADWYDVYNMASKLSENEDLSTISSYGYDWQENTRTLPTSSQDYSSLSLEDQQRTRTLDRLAMNRDWTGVAVTAALYAEESGTSKEMQASRLSSRAVPAVHQTTELDDLPHRLNDNVRNLGISLGSNDLDGVLRHSSAVAVEEHKNAHNNQHWNSTTQNVALSDGDLCDVRKKLEESLFQSNWALVGAYSSRLRDLESKMQGNDTAQSLHKDLVDINSPELSDSSDPESVKKQTIAKLINEKKWKGISIMAGLYDMESKSSLSK